VAGLEQNLSQSRRRGALARAGLAAAFLVATLVAATLVAATLVAATLVAASLVAAAQGQSAAIGADVIFARKSLMNAVCDRMMVIERMIAFGKIDLADARRNSDAIAAMLLAFPHLFPPGSNQWNPNPNRDPVADTFASPDLWISFPDFYQRATAAAGTAHDMSRAERIDDVKTRARALRIACDTCHALYLKDP